MNSPRDAILARLRAAPEGEAVPAPPDLPRHGWNPLERYGNLKRLMESVDTEFVETTEAQWPARLADLLRHNGIQSLAHGTREDIQAALAEACGNTVKRHPFDRDAEGLRDLLFTVDAGFTTCRGGIAETGSLVLWPGGDEPRMLSLVPPIHIVLLRARDITDSLADALAGQDWAARMPTNLVLLSGPSKTADIEQTLAYGVHGPKRLIVITLMDGME